MNAIILSAGLGSRLMPITETIPKPLLPIINRPIIEINIQRLLKAGVEKIGINLFHKANKIKEFLDGFSERLNIVVEDELKGTGGALLNFAEFLKDDLIIHNCDVLSNINLTEAMNFHKSYKSIVTIILTKNFGTNVFRINRNFRIKGFSNRNMKNYYTYTGIAILSNRIRSYLPKKEIFSIIDIYQRIINENGLILGLPIEEAWYDIGTHDGYWQVHKEILLQKIKMDEIHIDSQRYIHPSSEVQTKNLSGFVSIGPKCFIGKKVSIENTIVFENSRIEDGNFKNCLLSNKFCIRI